MGSVSYLFIVRSASPPDGDEPTTISMLLNMTRDLFPLILPQLFRKYPPCVTNGPLTRYVKLQVAHAPGMPGTFSPAADFKGNRWLAIPACITARAWRTCRGACRDRLPAVTGKTFPAFPAHAHPQICVSGKRPITSWIVAYDFFFKKACRLFMLDHAVCTDM